MRAAQLVAPRQWELIETAKPPQPAAGQMLVRMERVAVCGSDKPPFCGVHKRYPQPPGATGHEGMGVVEACPSGRYREGERVLLWGFDRGLFQEYVLAKDDGGCIRLPGDLSEEKVLMSQLLGHGDPQLLQAGQYYQPRCGGVGPRPGGAAVQRSAAQPRRASHHGDRSAALSFRGGPSDGGHARDLFGIPRPGCRSSRDHGRCHGWPRGRGRGRCRDARPRASPLLPQRRGDLLWRPGQGPRRGLGDGQECWTCCARNCA